MRNHVLTRLETNASLDGAAAIEDQTGQGTSPIDAEPEATAWGTRVRQTAAAILASTGVLQIGGFVASRIANDFLSLAYHRIVPSVAGHVGDLELVSATAADFAWQMEYIARRFEPVTFATVADALDGRKSLPKRAVVITFDDGFSDAYEHAFPVLRRLGMPATVFVSTDYADRPIPFWFDLVAWTIMIAPPGPLRFNPLGAPLAIPSSKRDRREAAQSLLTRLKRCPESDRAAAVSQFQELLSELKAATSLGRGLSWSEMREMAAGGIEFGSHTASHCSLTSVSGEMLDYELHQSRKRLEEELGTQVTAVAYPFGGASSFNKAVIEGVRRAGYRVAVSYLSGVNSLAAPHRYALRRQHVELGTSRSYFEAIVNAPRLFS
jgi:peptidoglycan/xylan/chitin deacetylase (PgdA/CDA1 family)